MNDDMNFKRIIALAVVLTTLVSCTPNNNESQSSPPVEMTKISTNNNEINQDQSNRAKNILSKNDNVTHVYAVNTKDTLVIAIKVRHMKRLRLQKIKQELTKKMKKEFPKMDVQLSTDEKIVIELEKLEKKLETTSISKKELKNRLQSIIDLSKEET